ncbi:MAG: hypothetical protein QGH51_02965 [Planctomycetota bacterium]|nr:hypothetical protein [Planctomycetota bacterium]
MSHSFPEVRFSRPGRQPHPADLRGRVAVMDISFDGDHPDRDLIWAEQLGERLVLWIDHHDQLIWEKLTDDSRFVLVPRIDAPACPPLITQELVDKHGPVDTLLCHGDLDGVLSAAKWSLLQAGLPCPDWLDPDSVVADSRMGEFTPRGARLDEALRGGNDATRRAIVASVLAEAQGEEEPSYAKSNIDRAQGRHQVAIRNTNTLMESATFLDDIPEDAVVVDIRHNTTRADLTHLLLSLQKVHDWVVVFARGKNQTDKILVGTDPAHSGLDLRSEFDLQGFAPFRVHVSPHALVNRLPSRTLQRYLRR